MEGQDLVKLCAGDRTYVICCFPSDSLIIVRYQLGRVPHSALFSCGCLGTYQPCDVAGQMGWVQMVIRGACDGACMCSLPMSTCRICAEARAVLSGPVHM